MATPSMAMARVKREIKEVRKDKMVQESQIKLIIPSEDDLRHLRGEVIGPPDTPYEGGKFYVTIEIPDTYPFSPPKCRFETKIWHPNISSQTGAICLDILKDQWAAAMSLRTVLLSLQQLLACPEPDDPQDGVVAGQYKNDHDAFDKTAKHWTKAYAMEGDEGSEESEKIKQLVAMGFDEVVARDSLSTTDWNLERAIERLFS
eukprot:m.89494 g.89494  ORF g.89494 m.89494 type:complete len:203 (+) comp8534_c1_seq1:185-793(+)